MIDAAVETIEARTDKVDVEGVNLDTLLDLAFDTRTTAREIHARAFGEIADRRAVRRALVRLVRLRAFLDERGGPRAPEQAQETEETAHLAAEPAFEALSHMPAFRHALAGLYPELFRERAEALDRIHGAQARGSARPYDPASTYRAGEIVAHARFGEGVVFEEPHDGRGLGQVWGPTDGCIGLANEDVTLLYALVPVGTKVTIKP